MVDSHIKNQKEDHGGYFPGGPVVETLPSNAGGVGLISGRQTKIPRALGAKKPKHKTEAIL